MSALESTERAGKSGGAVVVLVAACARHARADACHNGVGILDELAGAIDGGTVGRLITAAARPLELRKD